MRKEPTLCDYCCVVISIHPFPELKSLDRALAYMRIGRERECVPESQRFESSPSNNSTEGRKEGRETGERRPVYPDSPDPPVGALALSLFRASKDIPVGEISAAAGQTTPATFARAALPALHALGAPALLTGPDAAGIVSHIQ
jgi:hypothetical protein